MPGYFPVPSNSHGNARQRFAGYGQLAAAVVSVSEEGIDGFYPQYDHLYRTNMTAVSPALPLRPPNDYIDPLRDPCMQQLMEEYKEVQTQISHLLTWKHKYANSLKSKRKQLEEFVQKMDELGDDLTEDDFRLELSKLPEGFGDLIRKVHSGIGKNPFKPTGNKDYAGGGLACVTADGSQRQFLCAASGRELRGVAVSEVLRHNYRGVKLGVERTIELTSSSSAAAAAATSMVYQIDAQTVQDSMLGIARSKTDTTLFQIHADAKPEILSEMRWNETQSVALNRYIPGEYAVVSDSGISIVSSDSTVIRTIRDLQPRFACSMWSSVHWGRYPREIVHTNPTAMDMYDFRMAGDSKAVTLFELPHPSLRPMESITVSKPHTSFFHHLLATDCSLILTDVRFPNHPVLKWSHNLLSEPSYIYPVSSNQGLDTVLLASQLTAEVHCFQMTLGDEVRPVQGKGPPWKASMPRDFVVFGSRQGLDVHPAIQECKLDLPLVGVCGMKSPEDEDLTIFQMTSHGDVFAQRFEAGCDGDLSYGSGPGSDSVRLPDSVLDYVKEWLPQCEEMLGDATREAVDPYVHTVDASELGQDMIHSSVFPHMLCPNCLPTDSAHLTDQTGEECMSCNVPFEVSRAAHEMATEGTIPAGEVSDVKEVIMDDEHCEFPNNDVYTSLLFKLTGEEEGVDISTEIKQRDEEVKKQRHEMRKEKAKKKRSEREESDDCSEDMETIEGEESVTELHSDATSPEKFEDSEQDASPAIQETPASSTPQAFVTEEEIVQFMTQKQQKEKHSSSSQGSVSSGGSHRSNVRCSPGFSTTPRRMRSPQRSPQHRRSPARYGVGLSRYGVSLSQPVQPRSHVDAAPFSSSQPNMRSVPSTLDSSSLSFDFIRPIGSSVDRPVVKHGQGKKRKRPMMGF